MNYSKTQWAPRPATTAARARRVTVVGPDNVRHTDTYTKVVGSLCYAYRIAESDTIATQDWKRPGNVYLWSASPGQPMRLLCLLAPPENKHHSFMP
jgi:hypothetical protein